MTGKAAYRKFLKSDFWKELSERVKLSAGKCQRCRRKTKLESHHVRYPKDWYQTTESDLIVLCRKCHRKVHGLRPERRVQNADGVILRRASMKFNLAIHQMGLMMRKIHAGTSLTVEDEKYLDQCLILFPPTPKDSCIEFTVGLTRKFNKLLNNPTL